MRSRAAARPDPSHPDLPHVVIREAAWTDPVEVGAAFADEPFAGVLLSPDGWSYLVRRPDVVVETGHDLAALLGAPAALVDGPPFQGGVVGLAAYELSAALEPTAPQVRSRDWPDLSLMRYPALLAFHAEHRRAVAIGRGAAPSAATANADFALSWLDAPRPAAPTGVLSEAVELATSDARHAAAVAETVGRIAAGEIFQANLARPWRGRLAAGVAPFDVFRRLARQSAAGYAAYLRLPGRALVSNSPERFLSVRPTPQGLSAETHPIKGTRPRGADPAADAALAASCRPARRTWPRT